MSWESVDVIMLAQLCGQYGIYASDAFAQLEFNYCSIQGVLTIPAINALNFRNAYQSRMQ
jgi:hypothetical protein